MFVARLSLEPLLGRGFAVGRVVLVLLLAASLPVTALSAQGTVTRHDSLTADSLAARLARAEAAIALLRQQLAVEASTAVRTESRLRVDLTGRILMNGYRSSGPVNSGDVPTYMLNEAPTEPRERTLGLSLRQSRLGLALGVDSVLGATLSAELELDFFAGGAAAAGDGYQFPEPRLRTASVVLQWAHAEVMAGSESPLIAALNPVTLASVGEPGFGGAGNLWNWMPQVRVSHDLGSIRLGDTRFGMALQAALLDPSSPHYTDPAEYAVHAGARSGRPYVQGRARIRWGAIDSDEGEPPRGEIGIGVHRGWLRLAGDTLTTSRAVSIDARITLGGGLELRGEAYRGRALSGLGGGAIEQTLGAPAPGATVGVPLRDHGGWAQLNWRATPTTMVGAGCGRDQVEVADRPDRQRNTVCAAHGLWRPIQPLVFGVEVRGLRTLYAGRTVDGRHLNFSIGIEL